MGDKRKEVGHRIELVKQDIAGCTAKIARLNVHIREQKVALSRLEAEFSLNSGPETIPLFCRP